MSRSTCTYCGHDVGGHAGVKGCYEPSAPACCSEFRRSLEEQVSRSRAALARATPNSEETPMGNHNIDCDFCGEDTRGLSGVRGCSTQAQAERCHAYKAMEERSPLRRAPVLNQQAPEVQEARPLVEGGACPLAEPETAPAPLSSQVPTDLFQTLTAGNVDVTPLVHVLERFAVSARALQEFPPQGLIPDEKLYVACENWNPGGGSTFAPIETTLQDVYAAGRVLDDLVAAALTVPTPTDHPMYDRGGDRVRHLENRSHHDRERIQHLEDSLATATRRAQVAESKYAEVSRFEVASTIQSAADKEKIGFLEGRLTMTVDRAERAESEAAATERKYRQLASRTIEDSEALDWIEATAKKSQTGISFDWVPPGQGGRSGFRFMRRFFVGDACDTLRAAIRSALGGVIQAERDDPKSTGKSRAELVAELVRAARNQVEYFRRKQAGLVPLEEGDNEDGSARTPIGDYPAWEVGQANGRMSEAAWWLGVLEEVQRGGSVPKNDLVPDVSHQDKGSRTYLGEPYVPELQYYAEADAAEFYLVDDVAIYRHVDPFLSTAHCITSGAMVGFRITDPRAWVRSILPPVESETMPPAPVVQSGEALATLANRIERLARGWQGQNGGIFTIRGMAVAMAHDLFADYGLQRPTSPPPEPVSQEPSAPTRLARAVEESLRTYDTQRLQFGTTQETIDVMAPLVAARPDFRFSTGVGTTERVPLDEFVTPEPAPTPIEVPDLETIAWAILASVRPDVPEAEVRRLLDIEDRQGFSKSWHQSLETARRQAAAVMRVLDVEDRWVTTGRSDWYRGGPRGFTLRQEWKNQYGVTEWRDVTDDELRQIERR